MSMLVLRWFGVLGLVVLAGCSSEAVDPSQASLADTESTSIPPTTSSLPVTTTASTSEATATTAGSLGGSDDPTAVASTVPASVVDETEPLEVLAEIPVGSFVAERGDLIVLRTDGDLEYRPGAVSGDGGEAVIALVDNADPREEVAEGPGPNVIDHVAGIVNGSIIYGDCCEPVAGNVYALTEALAPPQNFQFGYSPSLSPVRSTLLTVNDYLITAIDTMSGDGIGVQPNPGPDDSYRSVFDLEWIDNETFVVLFYEADGLYQLVLFDAANLTEMSPPVEIPGVSDAGRVSLAGRTPTGLIAVEVDDTDSTTIRYHDPASLTEQPDLTQTFPATVSAVEVDPDGLGQIWVDNTTLYHLGPDDAVPMPLANGVLAAWFVPTP